MIECKEGIQGVGCLRQYKEGRVDGGGEGRGKVRHAGGGGQRGREVTIWVTSQGKQTKAGLLEFDSVYLHLVRKFCEHYISGNIYPRPKSINS